MVKGIDYITVRRWLAATVLLLTGIVVGMAQDYEPPVNLAQNDTISQMLARLDSITRADSLAMEETTPSVMIDTTKTIRRKRDWSKWTPNPQRALWLALVIPGAGQIYNRKYWKLPFI